MLHVHHQRMQSPFWLLCLYGASVCQNWSLDDKLQTGTGNEVPAPVLQVFIVWNISFGNGVHWYLWLLNHQYLCNFCFDFQKGKGINELNTHWTLWFFCVLTESLYESVWTKLQVKTVTTSFRLLNIFMLMIHLFVLFCVNSSTSTVFLLSY